MLIKENELSRDNKTKKQNPDPLSLKGNLEKLSGEYHYSLLTYQLCCSVQASLNLFLAFMPQFTAGWGD